MRITGSTLPLLSQCQYWARPEVDAPPLVANEAMQVGTEVHAAIESVLSKKPHAELSDEALEVFDTWDAWWPSSELRAAGEWKPEIAYAYDPKTDTARCLGNVGGRNYGKLEEGEIAGSIDAVCVSGSKAIIIDWKTGWDMAGLIADAKDNRQLRGYALAVARHHGVETVEVHVVRINEEAVKVSSHVMDAFDLADAASELKALIDAIPASLPKAGTHCRRCRAVAVCPSTAKSMDAIAPKEVAIDAPAPVPLVINENNAAALYARMVAVRAACDAVEAGIKAYVDANGGFRLDNGKVYKQTETNRSSIKLDGREGSEAVALLSRNGVEGAVEVTPRTSQAAIKRVLQAAGLKGKDLTAKLDAIMDELSVCGAIRTTTIKSYREA